MMLRALVLAGLMAASSTAAAQVRFGSEAGNASVRVVSYRDIPFRTVVRQQFDYSCGSAALATLMTFHLGKPRSEAQVFQAMFAVGDQARIRKAGFSLLDMKTYLGTQGYAADGFRVSWDRLQRLDAPSIAMIVTGTYRHFVVIKGVRGDSILVGDPALGLKPMTRAEFEKQWNGIVFLIRDSGTESLFNAESEWAPYAPTPWSIAREAADLQQGLSREGAPLYQISPVFSLNDIIPR